VPGQGPSPIPASWQGVVTPLPSEVASATGPMGPPAGSTGFTHAETGSNQGTTHCLRALEQAGLQAQGRAPDAFRAPPEVTGPGTLFPSLVVALGNVGLTVMQRLRENLNTYTAPLTQLQHLRFLLVDTDPDVMRNATRGASSLSAGEILLAP